MKAEWTHLRIGKFKVRTEIGLRKPHPREMVPECSRKTVLTALQCKLQRSQKVLTFITLGEICEDEHLPLVSTVVQGVSALFSGLCVCVEVRHDLGSVNS